MAHRNREPLEDLLLRGATEASSPKEIAEASDVVILCVTGAPQMEQIIYGENGLMEGVREGLIVIFLAMGIVALISETVAAVAATGIEKKGFYDIVTADGVNCAIYQRIITRAMEEGDYSGLMFTVANAAKDLRYYTRMTEDVPLVGNLGNAVHHACVQASNLGLADEYVGPRMKAQTKLIGIKIFGD